MVATYIAVSLALTIPLILYLRRPKHLPLPPGPQRLPLIGSLHKLPSKFQWETYKLWSDQYASDVLYFSVAGIDVVLLNSKEAAIDLFEKRSPIYSSRIHSTMLLELMGWDWGFPFMPYGDRWREHRKLFHSELSAETNRSYYPQQTAATHELLRKLLDSPDEWMEHLRHMIGRIVMSIGYGIEVQPSKDPYIETAHEALSVIALTGQQGRFLVDSLPVLKYVPEWFPGAGFQRIAKEGYRLGRAMVERPFEATKRNIAGGTAVPSFVQSCLQEIDLSKDVAHQEEVIQSTAAAIYTAGSDTAVSALGTFILAMVKYPEVQTRAREELDEVIGVGNLPNFADEPSLPYISAIVKEVLRWQPATPIGIPHVVETDDIYKGYHIPAGALVIANEWAMSHEEKTYSNPYDFNPDRFMKAGKLNPDVLDPIVGFTFGFGRRICPGRFLALSEIWIVVASILSCFEITKALDENGEPIEPAGEYISAIISHPLPFKCKIRPRSREAVNIVKATLDQAT